MREKTATKPKTMRLLSMLLVVTMLVTAQGFTSLAATVSRNEVATEEREAESSPETESDPETESSPETESRPETESNTASENIIESETSDTTQVETVMQAGTTTPANPVHNCTGEDDGTDTTTWSYVYFGSYPQSEVTDTTIISAIDSAILAGNSITADAGTDVWVNGTKYRRISKSDTNYGEYFDDVTNNGYRYFKWERIKWRVLNNNGSTLFVVADEALDCKCYNDEWTSITWEDSTIRSWLNDSFYNTAFSIEEQNAIVAQNVVNADNPGYGTEGGNNTTDKVYLLSIDEVTNATYGFCSDDSTDSVSRWMQTSAYANARGAWRSTDSGYEGNCWWWLRSPGGSGSCSAAFVHDYGSVDRSGYSVALTDDGVVPALHINLSSGIWSMTDDGTSGDGGEGGNNPTKFSVTYMSKNQMIESISVISGNTIAEPKEPVAADGEIFAGWYKDSDYNEKWDFAKDLVVEDCVLYAKWEQKSSDGVTNPGGDNKNPQTPNGEAGNNHSDQEAQTEDIKVTGLKITAPSKKLTAGKKVQLSLTISPENATNKTVTWKTSNSKYATIDKNGKLSIKKAGAGKTVTVTATAADGSTVEATYKINIMKHAVKSIKLSAASKSVKAGKSITVKATVKTTGKSVNKTLKWMSSNTKYATVSKSGKVKTKKAGKGKTVTITATSTDGTNKKAKIKIKIK